MANHNAQQRKQSHHINDLYQHIKESRSCKQRALPRSAAKSTVTSSSVLYNNKVT
jgi:hypothetical protein